MFVNRSNVFHMSKASLTVESNYLIRSISKQIVTTEVWTFCVSVRPQAGLPGGREHPLQRVWAAVRPTLLPVIRTISQGSLADTGTATNQEQGGADGECLEAFPTLDREVSSCLCPHLFPQCCVSCCDCLWEVGVVQRSERTYTYHKCNCCRAQGFKCRWYMLPFFFRGTIRCAEICHESWTSLREYIDNKPCSYVLSQQPFLMAAVLRLK